VTRDDSHPNAKAAELFSAAIADNLRATYPDLFGEAPPGSRPMTGGAAASGG
jgi:hypothetical protein